MTQAPTGPVVDVRHANRSFHVGGTEVQAVRDVSISVERGGFVALIGRSGSGKTTLLNLIAGLDRPDSGEISVNGEDIARFSERQLTHLRRHTIGFIFQSFGLLPLLSAQENVEIALRIAGAGLRERRRRTDELLEAVGLTGRAKHRPYELSGGEQQRVAIARALANKPALILADEPTGELDSSTAVSIFQLLHSLVEQEHVTIIAATHDRTVMELVPRIEEMRDGRLLRPEEQELFRYTTREERSHFATELPRDVQEEVAARVSEAGGLSLRPAAPPRHTPAPLRAGPAAEDGGNGNFAPPPDRERPDWARPREAPQEDADDA